MTVLKIDGPGGKSDIYLDNSIETVQKLAKGKRCAIVTDENVYSHYGSKLDSIAQVILIPAGEGSKTVQKMMEIHRRLVEFEFDRSSMLVGVGGGVVTDLVGFVASTFLRGISFGFVATTVLAQVDAAIGGKNGVNLDGYKNLVGIIRQPKFVINDTSMLQTLPEREMINGISEVIKSGLIGDRALFEALESASTAPSALKALDLGSAISKAAGVKVEVVNRDVFESGPRRHLNLGHTLGHAVEKVAQLPHGFAVGVGMVAAAKISAARGMLSQTDFERIRDTVSNWGLIEEYDADAVEIMDAVKKDKKRKSDSINFVLPVEPGRTELVPIEIQSLEEILEQGVL